MYIPNKFTFTVYEPDFIFTATRNGEKYDIERTANGVYTKTDYAPFIVEQFLTPNTFNGRADWTIKEIIHEIPENIRENLKTDSPSIELQHAALAEITRLDAIIAKFLDIPVRRYLDGEAYDIPGKLVDEFDSIDIKWVLEDESDERWDICIGKYHEYKV